jgi:hypothetical protein
MASVSLTVQTLMSELVVPYGYTDNDAGVFGFWVNLIGNLGGIFASIVIGKTGHYKYTTIGLILMTIVTAVMFQMCVVYIPPAKGYWAVLITLNLFSIFNMGIFAYSMEYAVKLAPTIGESISGGTII